MEKFEM
jgi:hypothetical protein